MSVLFCPECGVSNRADDEECVECGVSLDAQPADAAAARTRTARPVARLDHSRSHRPRPSGPNMQSIAIVGTVVLLLSVGVVWYATSNITSPSRANVSRSTGLIFPKGLKPRLDEFRDAWSRSDIEAVVGFFAVASKHRARQFRKGLESRGWQAELPAISEPELHSSFRGDRGNFVAFVCGGGVMRSEWMREKQEWVLKHLSLPKE